MKTLKQVRWRLRAWHGISTTWILLANLTETQLLEGVKNYLVVTGEVFGASCRNWGKKLKTESSSSLSSIFTFPLSKFLPCVLEVTNFQSWVWTYIPKPVLLPGGSTASLGSCSAARGMRHLQRPADPIEGLGCLLEASVPL